MAPCGPGSVYWWIEKLGIPILTALVTLAVATAVAYLFTEKWQRRRQKRDLQFKTISEFSARTDRVVGSLTQLFYAVRANRPKDELIQRASEVQLDIGALTSDLERFYVFDDSTLQSDIIAFSRDLQNQPSESGRGRCPAAFVGRAAPDF